jgi:apolipoprotein N-acyltransferase
MQAAPANSPLLTRLSTLPRWPAGLLALAAGALAALGFEPVGSIAGPILGVALLLMLLSARPVGHSFGLGFLFGWGHFMVGLTWIATAFTYQAAMPAVMGWVAVVGLSAFLALYPALAAWAARRVATGIVPLVLWFAGLFILTEILRGNLFSGFAWNPLGAGWLQLEGVAALAAVIGANGLSGLAVLAAGSLAALAAGRGEPGRGLLVGVFPLLLAIGLIVPAARPAPAAPKGPGLLLVQPNIGQREKQAPGGFERSLQKLAALTLEGLARQPATAAVVWPEAAVEYPLEEMPDLRAQLGSLLKPGQLLLTGGVAIERDAAGRATGARNSLYALDSKGRILMRYDKAHLVPGGEYLPLRRLAEPLGLARLVPGDLDFLPGPGARTFRLPGLPSLGPAICYEIIFPGAIVDREDRPAFILTVSNDAWFGASGPPQHHEQARLRAIEEGLPVARVTPTGFTGFIGPRGELLETLPRHQAGALSGTLPAPLPATPFARLGLTAPGLFALLLVALGALGGRRKT